MIEIDDSEFSENDREFLNRWAEVLHVPASVLMVRIVKAAIDGEHYVKERPQYLTTLIGCLSIRSLDSLSRIGRTFFTKCKGPTRTPFTFHTSQPDRAT